MEHAPRDPGHKTKITKNTITAILFSQNLNNDFSPFKIQIQSPES